jgi:DNA modification methylase
MKISDKEKNEIINYVKAGKYLPEKYKFLIFEEQDDVSLTWLDKEFKITNVNLPFQSIEHVDTPRSEENVSLQKDLFDFSGRQLKGWTNKLIWGDNKLILSSLRNGQIYEEIQNQGGLKLVYIDPPFDVGAKFYMPITIGKHDLIKSPSVLEEVAYDDTWGKGLNSFNQMIYERLYLIKNLMSEDGSIYVHCDWRVNSYMRIILDEIFGKENFKNEIIWSYRIQGVGKKFWARKHDSIYFYTKSDKYTFYPEKEKNIYEKPFIDTQKEKSKIEDLSKKQKEDILKKISNNQSIDPKFKNYIFDTYFNEVYVRDVWDSDSTKPLISGSKEYLKYPTQKPEGLLKRIIKASSNEGDLIADFFAGSGTSISVAEQMNRKWIGTDLSKYSIHTSRKRLIETQRKLKSDGKSYRAFEVLNLGKYERQYFMKSFNKDLSISEKIKNINFKKFKKLVIDAYNAKSSEGYQNFDAVKNNSLIHIGPVDYPVTREDILRIIEESKQSKIRSVHILAFDYEMGLFPAMINQAKDFGITIEAKKFHKMFLIQEQSKIIL